MKTYLTMIAAVILFSTLTYGKEINLEISKLKTSALKESSFIYYGNSLQQAGFFKGEKDFKPYGISAFSVNNGYFYLADNVNMMLKTGSLKTGKIIKEQKTDAPATDVIALNDNLFIVSDGNLLKSSENSWAILQKNIGFNPLYSVTNLKSATKTKKSLENENFSVTVRKKNVKTALVRLENSYLKINFTDRNLAAMIFLGKDKNNFYHFNLEFIISESPIKTERYWIKTDSEGNIINAANLPVSNIYIPIKDLFVDENGTFWMINPLSNGIQLLSGGKD